jgi:hypothetical protein
MKYLFVISALMLTSCVTSYSSRCQKVQKAPESTHARLGVCTVILETSFIFPKEGE